MTAPAAVRSRFAKVSAFVRHLLALTAMVWAAAVVVAGIQIAGPAVHQALTCLIVALLVLVMRWLLDLVVRALGLGEQRPVGCLGLAVGLLAAAALLPFALWLGAEYSQLLGLSLEVDGFWPLILGAVVIVVQLLLLTGAGSLLGREAAAAPEIAASTSVGLLRVLATLFALWLSITVVAGVTLESGAWWRELLTLVLLSALFSGFRFGFHFTGPGWMFLLGSPLVAGYAAALNLLMVWLLAWVSGWFELPLRVEGFGALLAVALLCTAVGWLAQFLLLVMVMAPWQGRDAMWVLWADLDLTVEISRFGIGLPTIAPDGW